MRTEEYEVLKRRRREDKTMMYKEMRSASFCCTPRTMKLPTARVQCTTTTLLHDGIGMVWSDCSMSVLGRKGGEPMLLQQEEEKRGNNNQY